MIEKKITSEGYEEHFYRPEDEQMLVYAAMVKFPWISNENISMLSRVESLDKTNITYDGIPSAELCELFNVQPYHIFCDYYAIEITGDKAVLKIYDRNLVFHALPSLPPGACIDSYSSGIGVIYDLETGLTDQRKVYYILNDIFYGLEYDVNTLMQKSLSQYTFEGDVNTW